MSKISAEELSERINDLDLEDEIKISLMEDVTDSVSEKESDELIGLKDELTKVKSDYEDLKEKYKSRFLQGNETDKKEEVKEDKDVEEKEVIDIKEI